MKINYDKEVDALYIELNKAKAFKTSERGGNVLVDFDKKGNVIGIEVLDYLKLTPKKDQLSISAGEKRIPIPA